MVHKNVVNLQSEIVPFLIVFQGGFYNFLAPYIFKE